MSEAVAEYVVSGGAHIAPRGLTRAQVRQWRRCDGGRLTWLSSFRKTSSGVALAVRESRPQREKNLPETLLHAAWLRAGATSASVTGRDGRQYRVIYPGRPADGAGPDFRDAILQRDDGVRVHGHVEVHVRSGDWHSHGHGSDRAYNGVAMHVVLEENGPPVETQSGVRIPLLLLKREHVAGPASHPSRNEIAPGTSGKAGRLAVSPAPLPLLDMDIAGDEWFRNRAHGCAMQIADSGADQALWEGALECLGYPANKKGFRQLASRLDWNTVSEFLSRATGAASQGPALAGVFLWAGGFGPRPHGAPVLKGRAPEWRARHGRPANHPRVRVRAATSLALRWHGSGGPSRTFVDAVKNSEAARELASVFIVPPESGRTAVLGRSRARDIVVNHLLSAVHALAAHGKMPGRGGPELAGHAKRLFDEHPLPASNSITREASRLLDARGVDGTPRSARQQQGLIHIYRMTTARQHPERQLPLL